ncbi:MAG: alpha/beta fold hydrolase [Thermoanaerobaculia bacterium]|nr:alpha/beta fold hydrolase [Thermoanaerobaculia bacterium]
MNALQIGSMLGPYRITAPVAAGGMGEVWRATDTRLDREVAIKVLSTHFAGNNDASLRFEREAKAVAALSHPNILSIFDFGTSNGVAYAVTELLEGETVRAALVREGPMSWRRAATIAAEIADGLDAAHRKGIIHRDLKPENAFLLADGRVKVLDFGLAHTVGAAERNDKGDEEPTNPYPNRHGGAIGTIGYMAPEQIRDEPVGPACDVFALGCLLQEMLTGRLPFYDPTPVEALWAVLHREPAPIRSAGVAIPVELERIVGQCLAKHPAERFHSARDLAFALRAVGSGTVSPSRFELSTPSGRVARKLEIPETRYARSGEVNIAYQVVGSGMIDLVFVMGWVSHLEYFWREPSFARFLSRLASFSRLILFDKRGTGLSDRVPIDQLPTLEQRMDDVRAVMEAAGSTRAALCGVSEGGPMCSLFAATYPEKTSALVMIGTYAKRIRDDDYPWGPTQEQREAFFDLMQREWGGPVGVAERAPSRAGDPEFRDWWAAYLRMGASPSAAVALTKMNAQIDIRAVLPTIRVPSLVIHRRGDVCLKVEEGRYVASRIPGAKFVELPGNDHLPFVGDQDEILDEIEEFLTGVRHAEEPDRVLATILSVRAVEPIVDPDVESKLGGLVQRETAWYRGRRLPAPDAELDAAFDGPARAVRCGAAIVESARRAGVSLAAGVHTGECDVAGESLSGGAVTIARGIARRAPPHGVVASATVRDLVAGAGIDFDELGELDGQRLFRVAGGR